MTQKLHPLLRVAYAFLDTILEAGDNGAPAGPMYAAWMEHGGTLDQFESIMQALVDSGKVRKSNHCYYAVIPTLKEIIQSAKEI